LAAGVVGPDGTVHSFAVVPTRRRRPVEEILADLWDLGHRALAEADATAAEMFAVGIGSGGPLDARRGVLTAPAHLPGWRDVPIVRLAAQHYGLAARVENDATAVAGAEYRWGEGRGLDNIVYLTVSTGLGGGAVLGGQLFLGAAGNGGELGHVTIDWHGRRCPTCGRRGCLEAYASGTAIAERAREQMEPGSVLAERAGELTAADVWAAAQAGDDLAGRIWAETVAALACGVVSIVNLFEPDLVVLGGGVTRSGAALLEPLQRAVADQAMGPAAAAVRVTLSSFGERAGVLGAAAVGYLAG
jgi:glucokinase